MQTTKYVVFKPPFHSEVVSTWQAGLYINKEARDNALLRWETGGVLTMKGIMVDLNGGGVVHTKFPVFIPGSQVLGEYTLPTVAQTIAREANEKEAKR